MKLICSRTDLLQGVSIVSKAVPAKTTMSILECVLIDASTDVIKLTANDMELGIETIINGEIVEKGIIALEAKLFADIVRKLPDNDIIIETKENNQVVINCGKAKFNLVGKSGEDFTYLPFIEKEDYISVSQFTLKSIIQQTIFSISDNNSNKMMAGELFEISGSELKVVALDGHRIAIRKIDLRDTYNNQKVIVPGKTLSEISKILSGDADKDVNIYFTKNHIVFEFENTVVVSRLIEGEYFRIEQMISNDYECKLSINKKEFIDCIDRATLLVKEGDKKPIVILIKDGIMELKISSYLGSMNEEIDIEKEGKDMLICFNPKFLLDALRVIEDENVNIYMMNSKAPCFIKNDEESYIYLVLPVNSLETA